MPAFAEERAWEFTSVAKILISQPSWPLKNSDKTIAMV